MNNLKKTTFNKKSFTSFLAVISFFAFLTNSTTAFSGTTYRNPKPNREGSGVTNLNNRLNNNTASDTKINNNQATDNVTESSFNANSLEQQVTADSQLPDSAKTQISLTNQMPAMDGSNSADINGTANTASAAANNATQAVSNVSAPSNTIPTLSGVYDLNTHNITHTQ